MNLPPLTPAEETEWGAQELALRAECGDATAPVPAAYRLIARALREPLPSAPPADFAATIARRAERLPSLEGRWEAYGIAAALAVLVVLVGVNLVLRGSDWLAMLETALPSLPRLFNGWGLLLLAGFGLGNWPLLRVLVAPTRPRH